LAPVIAAPLDDGPDLGIAELHQRGLVYLQIRAASRAQRRKLLPVDVDHIAPEPIERGIGLAQDRVLAAEKMQDDRRRNRQLGCAGGDGFNNREVFRENRPRPFQRLVNDELLDRDRFALLVAMKELALLRRESAAADGLSEKIDDVALAAKLAIGDR